jgi:hypothetical protein
MSDSHTKKMLREYVEQAEAPMFLTGFSQTPAENFHTTESVEFDVERDGEDLAIAVQDLSVGGRKNESTLYTNKELTPPIYKEEATVPAHKLLLRSAGQHQNMEPAYAPNAQRRVSGVLRKMENKIRRAVERMWSQVLQEAKVTLTDASGAALYEVDFSGKADHFKAVDTTWGETGADPIEDLEGMALDVYRNGKVEPLRAICGREALKRLIDDDKVQKFLDNRRMTLGALSRPQVRGAGGTFHGEISVGQFSLEIWSYRGFYIDPATGNATPYVADDNVIVMGDGRLDTTYGAVPRIAPPDPRATPFLGGRVSNQRVGIDLHPYAWLNPDGSGVTVQLASRPLTIPTAIDTFGCLTTTQEST